MKIIKPGHQHMSHDGLTPKQFIEVIGRTCYKSTDKITDDSAEKFVDNLISRNHWAMLEHETIYIECEKYIADDFHDCIYDANFDPAFFHISSNGVTNCIISGSIRSFYELSNKIGPSYRIPYTICYELKKLYSWVPFKVESNYIANPNTLDSFEILSRDEFNSKYSTLHNLDRVYDNTILFRHLTHTVKFVCDRGVSHELVRHRPCSFAQESTRYCNYSQDKYGKEITVILPIFYDTGMGTMSNSLVYDTWKRSCEFAEESYFKLLDMGSTPQEARDVLPNSLKTEIIMTATEEEWQHIVNLRAKGTTGQPHPQMVEIMQPWYEELKEITNGRIN